MQPIYYTLVQVRRVANGAWHQGRYIYIRSGGAWSRPGPLDTTRVWVIVWSWYLCVREEQLCVYMSERGVSQATRCELSDALGWTRPGYVNCVLCLQLMKCKLLVWFVTVCLCVSLCVDVGCYWLGCVVITCKIDTSLKNKLFGKYSSHMQLSSL